MTMNSWSRNSLASRYRKIVSSSSSAASRRWKRFWCIYAEAVMKYGLVISPSGLKPYLHSTLLTRRSSAALPESLPAAPCHSAALPLQQIHFVHVHRLLVAEEGDDDAEADRGFGGGVGNHEDREHLPVQSVQPRERHQVQVHGIQDQLNRHQNDDHVAPRQHADGANDEQRRRNNEVMQCGDLSHVKSSSWP